MGAGAGQLAPPSFVPWHEQLARHARACAAPWLIVPKAPQRGMEHEAISYRTLFDDCERIRGGLARRGIGVGERVLVVADNSAESLVFILGALSAGAAIVPIAPAGLGQSPRGHQDRLQRVVADCAPRLLFAPKATTCQVEGVDACDLRTLLAGSRVPSRAPQVSARDLAIIQYTSGTTEAARGVTLTHANVFHNITSIGAAIDAASGQVGASWLPTFHDMGLIGFLLAAFSGLSLVMLRPSTFYLRPEAWLWAIARFRAHYSMAPNAAYRLCASKMSESKLRGMDLSRWRVAFNGADLIHPDSMHAFAQRFAPHGFCEHAMLPVYGLAENTLAATLPTVGRPPSVDWVDGVRLEDGDHAQRVDANAPGARGVVSVGRTLPGQCLRIVHSDTGEPLGARQVGEVQLSGPSTTAGYWSRQPSEPQPFSEDGWLRTGDRGYLVDGVLHVLGRYRTMAKRFGTKIDCAFVAAEVLRAVPIRADAVAVFGSYDEQLGSEKLVVAAEAHADERGLDQGLSHAIVQAVRELLSFAPDEVLLLPPGSIPRTTSGKIRHAEARERYQRRAYDHAQR